MAEAPPLVILLIEAAVNGATMPSAQPHARRREAAGWRRLPPRGGA